jgi:HD-like signal output (HDOD) protein
MMMTQAESVVQKVKDLAALPQVVHQIIHLTNNPNASVKDLERLISIDQGMSTRVLNTVNSAYYGFSRKIASIKDAVVLLGFKAVRNLAMTVSVFDLFVGKTDRQNLRRGKWWRHSIDTALCARLIASQVAGVSPDEAYTAGLLHDIGKPLLDRYGDAPYEQVEVLIAQGVPELTAERQVVWLRPRGGRARREPALGLPRKTRGSHRLPPHGVGGRAAGRAADRRRRAGEPCGAPAASARRARHLVVRPAPVG